ncbi:c-type cytochrome [Leptospira sp. GIMC2001]|uniref:c-type cytochrome n=1 Tax=Leptospira sp. GIMC2001 TaxID=1513297 RepID=UPI0023493BC7|nr:c-type cytochrome [Leptospira sp. GIMC2001]WCL50508.1 c-type cytochrome [Leptospira sp. GIMC2001]
MDNHGNKEFDGIRQLGNDLPAWYKHIFVYAIFVGIGYAIYFHGFSSWGTEEQYAIQMAEHEEKYPQANDLVSEDGSNPLRDNAEAIQAGEKYYKAVCAACHGLNAEGVVGPSLVDKEWIHGNTDSIVYNNVMLGIAIENTKLQRGPMPAHEKSLGSEKVYQVMAWLASKNPSLVAK